VSNVDQFARDSVAKANAAIVAHERVCEECRKADASWRGYVSESLQRIESGLNVKVSETQTAMQSGLGELRARLWWFAGMSMSGSLAVILTLLGKG